jgi:hypothetical protein
MPSTDVRTSFSHQFFERLGGLSGKLRCARRLVAACTWGYSCKVSKMLLRSNKCATPDCEYVTNEKSNVLLQIHTSLAMYAGCVLNLRNFKVDFSCTECHLEQLQLIWNQGPTDPSPMGKACLHKPALTKPSVFSPCWVANW